MVRSPSPFGEKNDVSHHDGLPAEIAAKQVHIVPGKKHQIAILKHGGRPVLKGGKKLAFDHIMIGDQMRGVLEKWRAHIRRHSRGDTPGRRKFRPHKNAAAQLRDPEDIRQGIHSKPPSGALDSFSGAPIIDHIRG